MPDLQAFGTASLASSSGLVYKLLGRGDTEDNYTL